MLITIPCRDVTREPCTQYYSPKHLFHVSLVILLSLQWSVRDAVTGLTDTHVSLLSISIQINVNAIHSFGGLTLYYFHYHTTIVVQ